jgi:hypothetical protein
LYRTGLGGSTICGGPVPLIYLSITDLPALPKGLYDISYYIVPHADTFPPNDADLPNYFIEAINFEIRALINIDTLSTWSLLSMTVFLFIVGFIVIRKKNLQNI